MTDKLGDKPPPHALHGPWEGDRIDGAAREDAVLQAISNGNCQCTVCQHRKSCASLDTDWKWQRYPTESQIRTRGSVSAVPIMSRPVWIFSDRG